MKDQINCDRFAELLADLLEREVPEQARAAMESHALACDECGPLLADLRRLRVDAANLPELTPSRDLWSGIAARIETPIVALPAATTRVASERKPPVRAWWLGLAAAALIAVTATITREMTRRAIAPAAATAANTVAPTADTSQRSAVVPTAAPSTPSAATPAMVASAAANKPVSRSTPVAATAKLASNRSEKPTADQTYDREIAKLRAVLEYRRHDLDSSTVAVVDKNLKIIDDAIAQCRSALKKDPASRYLLESLNEALDSKVQLLRTAATMPSRS